MSYYLQTWRLTDSQSIHLTQKNTITFRYHAKQSGRYRGVSIPVHCLRTVKEFSYAMETTSEPFQMPVDGKVWIQHRYGMVKLYVLSGKCQDVEYRFFRFSAHEWKIFIKHILPDIISFTKNGAYQADGSCKSHAHDKSKDEVESCGHREAYSSERSYPTNWETQKACDKSKNGSSNNVDVESEEQGEIVDCSLLS